MDRLNPQISLQFKNTRGICPIGEVTGKLMMAEGQIPVISCEGSCIRGEIARLAADMLAKEAAFGRGCHGEFFTVPHSAMARWANRANRIVVIDGCFLHCHGRIMEGLFGKDQLSVFDALSYYGKYTNIMSSDGVPEPERRETARIVFNKVFDALNRDAAVSSGNKTNTEPPNCQSTLAETINCCK